MHLKGLAMAPYKFPCSIIIEQKIFYGKELVCLEATDSQVCFLIDAKYL